MRRRPSHAWSLISVIVLGGLLPIAASTRARGDEGRPNVVFVLVDDMGYADVGCYGARDIRTPNLDRMAREGMQFTRFYAGATVCAPSFFA